MKFKVEKLDVFTLRKIAIDKLYNILSDRFYVTSLEDSVQIDVHNNNCTRNFKIIISKDSVCLMINGEKWFCGQATEASVSKAINRIKTELNL